MGGRDRHLTQLNFDGLHPADGSPSMGILAPTASPCAFSASATMHPPKPFFSSLLLPLALAGCAAVGPDHRPPEPTVDALWSSPLPHGGQRQQMDQWWQRFNDPVLSALQKAAEDDSPTLAAAWGNVQIARATRDSSGASTLPTLSTSASAARARQGGITASSRSASLDAAWELDLFGQVRRNVESADASVEARRHDWHDARVTLAAEVASTYVAYRACGQLVELYDQELVSIGQTARATESLVRAGLNPGTDASLSRATLASTRSALLAQKTDCELQVKSLTQLTGLPDADVKRLLAGGAASMPQAPAFDVGVVPAQALRQRPDVAAQERALAAASANIGVAQADLYPSLQLGGSFGISVSGGASARSWSFGPSLSIPLFDGGARRAAVASARASHEVAYAQWRATVREAVAEVEQALLRLDDANQRVVQAERAAQEYQRYFTGAESERRAGTISLLTLEETRRQALSAQLTLVGLQRDRVSYWIALYKALGGGWDSAAPTEITPPRSLATRPTP